MVEEKPEKTLKEKIDRELDRFTVRMQKLGIYPLCVAALWLEPKKLEAGEKALGATVSVCGPGDSGLTREFLQQNAVYGLQSLTKMLMEKNPELFTKPESEPVH